MSAGEHDSVSARIDRICDHSPYRRLRLGALDDPPLHQVDPFRAGPGDHLDTCGEPGYHRLVELSLERGCGRIDGDGTARGFLRSRFHGGFHTDHGQVSMTLSDRVESRRRCGVASNHHTCCAFPDQPVRHLVCDRRDLFERLRAIWCTSPVGDVAEVGLRQEVADLTENG
jgi:hypothetical protein